jgi:hypothetical protein
VRATPGPWGAAAHISGRCVAQTLMGVHIIAPERVEMDTEVDDANAHLIAAAPLMRDALQITHDMLARQLDSEGYGPDSWGDDEHEAFRALKQALAAAEGK